MGLVIVGCLGTPLVRLVGVKGPLALRLSLVVGTAFLTLIAVATNLFFPARSGPTILVLLVLSSVCVATSLGSSRVRGLFFSGWRQMPLWIWAPVAVSVVVLAVGSSLTPTHYDFGLYHFAGVRYAADYAVVPGLGNLISYLGYANSESPLAALMMNGPGGDFGFQALNGLFAMVLLGDCVLRFMAPRIGVGAYVAAVNTAIAWIILLLFADQFVASPTSDTVVFILIALAISAFAEVVDRGKISGAHLISVFVPLLIAVTLRPQSLIVLGCMALVVLIVGWRRGVAREACRALTFLGSLAGLSAVLMLARDYFLTGRAVYPLSLWTWNVPWLTEDPAELRRITIAIARDPSPSYQAASDGFGWLPSWVLAQFHQWEAALACILLAACAGMFILVRVRKVRPPIRKLAALTLPGFIFLLAWVFLLPPTWRHAYGAAFATLGALLGWLAYAAGVRAFRLAGAAFCLIAVIAVVSLTVRYPGKMLPMPEVPTDVRTLPSGLTVLVPYETDQCWGNNLLCTPMAPKSLRLLGPTLQDGFSVTPG